MEEALHSCRAYLYHLDRTCLRVCVCPLLLVSAVMLFLFRPGVAVHAAVCSVCDSQSGWFHALMSECTDGQILCYLSGTFSSSLLFSSLLSLSLFSSLSSLLFFSSLLFSLSLSLSSLSSPLLSSPLLINPCACCRWRIVCVFAVTPSRRAL